jgi:putative aminopeptidase FrvX
VPIPALLRDLLAAPGPSGHEEPVAKVWRDAAASFAEVRSDTLGTSFARVSAGGAATLAISGHVDEIGVAVTHIGGDGLLSFRTIGVIENDVLKSQRVVIAGRDGPVEGVVAGGGEKLHIDIGATGAEDAAAVVRVGDAGIWRGDPVELRNGRIASRALDNRLGAYVALEAARRVAEAGDSAVDVIAIASVQEEVGHGGAQTAAYSVEPDVALAIDVTYATDVPGGDPTRAGQVDLGSGAAITRGTIVNRHVYELLLRTAEEEGIPYSIEVYPGRTHTDADDFHNSRAGIPTGLVSVPLRYMHTPAEVASLEDLEAAVRLVVGFARRLTPDTSFLR